MSRHPANKPHKHAEQHILHEECDAMRLLAIDGWDWARLAITFEYKSERSLENHLYDMCAHLNKIRSVGKTKQTINTIKHESIQNPREIKQNLSQLECNTVSLLYAAGWTYKELKMIFEINSGQLTSHIKKRCSHRNLLNIEWIDDRSRVLQYTPHPSLTLPA